MSSERKVPDDRELEDFLAGRHPVGRAYREVSENQTAPRELDDAILRMAREHAATTPLVATPRRRPRWIQPVAIAATLALSLGVLMNIWRDPTLREQAAPLSEEDFGLRDAPAPSTAAPPPQDAAAQAEAFPEQHRRSRIQIPPVEDPRFDFYTLLPEEQVPRQSKEVTKPLESRRAEPFPGEAKLGATTPSSDDRVAPSPSPPPPPAPPRASAPAMDSAPRATEPPSAPPAAAAGAVAPSRPDLDPSLLERDAQSNLKKRLSGASDDFGGTSAQSSSMPAAKGAPSPAPVIEAREEKSEALAKEKAPSADADADTQASPSDLIAQARAALARGDENEVRRIVAELRRDHPHTALPEDLRPFAAMQER